jgi:Family of unknown function (DUF5309)
MTIIAGTFQSGTSKTNREKFSDVVSRVYPEESPIYSDISHEMIDGTHPEWPEQTINPPAVNAQLEGDEYAFDATLAPTRLGNWTQILRKTRIISESQEKADDAGNALKIRRLMIDAGVELKRDVELSIVANAPSVGGNTRFSGSLATWLTSNVARFTGGANGGFVPGTGLTTAATPGTKRAFTQTLLDDTMQAAVNSGAKVKNIYASLYNKRAFVNFMSNPNVVPYRLAVTSGNGNTLVSNAEFYHGPFGLVKFVFNQVMTAGGSFTSSNVFLTDPEMMSWIWFRPIKRVSDLAKTGDSEKLVIRAEGCLKVHSEKAHGVVADTFGLSATT